MSIVLTTMQKGGEHTIDHDLNFQNERYEAKHVVTFRNPKPDLLAALAESGSTGAAGGENGVRKGAESAKKKSRKDRTVCSFSYSLSHFTYQNPCIERVVWCHRM